MKKFYITILNIASLRNKKVYIKARNKKSMIKKVDQTKYLIISIDAIM